MLALIVLCFILFFYIISRRHRGLCYPPGPTPLPIVGNLLSVLWESRKFKCHHLIWQSWSQKYGNLLGLRLGSINVVVVTGIELIREVSNREVFEGRPDGFFYTMRSFGKKLGLVFSDGPTWHRTRRFVLKYLKNFGYNSRFMNVYIGDECEALVQLRLADAGEPILVNQMFHITIVNILWRLVAGKRYDLEDQRLKELCSLVMRLFKLVDMSGGFLNFLPFLRHFVPRLIGFTELQEIHNALHQYLREIIKEHQENLQLGAPKDVIDAFLIDMLESQDDKPTLDDLQVVCLDLLEAGMETVTNTAVFMLLHVVRNEDVQRKLHQEIDDIIGRDRNPLLDDRIRMVYTEAVILETLRISTVASMGIPHMALNDAKLGNYIIPKGTFILLSLYELHHGPHWKDPETFRPERFLTKEGNILQDEWLIPFGIGKRRCIGEGLARSELFMFLTHILQKFHLRIPKNEPLPSTEPIDGLSLSAKQFRIIFEPRKTFKSI
uniref:Farnesoate epoxidase n=2 Tax=Bombyx mori TaxID=7091 RepID=C15C1_BOMMO|nr:RecName: Full=Farnesoate epoxidase; AltName: Full=Cytochrome P450 15C1; AltName: Full=Protein dimolting; Short=mod; Flags: Precursor [Bombyx mori]